MAGFFFRLRFLLQLKLVQLRQPLQRRPRSRPQSWTRCMCPTLPFRPRVRPQTSILKIWSLYTSTWAHPRKCPGCLKVNCWVASQALWEVKQSNILSAMLFKLSNAPNARCSKIGTTLKAEHRSETRASLEKLSIAQEAAMISKLCYALKTSVHFWAVVREFCNAFKSKNVLCALWNLNGQGLLFCQLIVALVSFFTNWPLPIQLDGKTLCNVLWKSNRAIFWHLTRARDSFPIKTWFCCLIKRAINLAFRK